MASVTRSSERSERNLMKTNPNSNDILLVVDGSYFAYYCLYGSVSTFKKDYPDEASVWIKPPEECDQENLPNLLNCETYKRILKKCVMKRLETIDYIAKENFQDELDFADKVDVVFALDDHLKNNFRLSLYPTYKGTRHIQKQSYQVFPIKDYILNIIFRELDIEGHYGYHLVKVAGAEGDDVIATTLMNFSDRYFKTILIASDHDFLQIEDVEQFNLFGDKVERKLGDEVVTPSEFLLGKILMGDVSDNICQVFKKCGPKTALKLVKDKELLKKRLAEDQDAAKQFATNKKIISFNEIPKELTDLIVERLNVELYDRRPIQSKLTFKQFMI